MELEEGMILSHTEAMPMRKANHNPDNGPGSRFQHGPATNVAFAIETDV
jgi:hypothetical protein